MGIYQRAAGDFSNGLAAAAGGEYVQRYMTTVIWFAMRMLVFPSVTMLEYRCVLGYIRNAMRTRRSGRKGNTERMAKE